jgi:hypothetical protein
MATVTGPLLRSLVTAASSVQAAFGCWHFFVPRLWRWYEYIDPSATELVIAVRAVNFFFSLCLVLTAAVNLLLVFARQASRYALQVVLGGATLLWGARVALQILYPQGSARPVLQYGMLVTFLAVASAYAASFVVVTIDER